MSGPKVIFENQTALGQAVQQETLDTNRPGIKQESTDRFANAIAINSRGIWADLTQWCSYTAGAVGALELAIYAGLPPLAASIILVTISALIFGCTLSTIQRRKTLLFDGSIRILFFLAGVLIAFL